MNYGETRTYMEQYGQEHLLKYYDELPEDGQAALLEQIASIDFSMLSLLAGYKQGTSARGVFSPLGAVTVEEIDEKREAFESAGIEALKAGKTAAVLLAGGQGTRLGFDHPKGMYNIGETRELFIFECLINNLMDVVNRTGTYVPLYIMTSEINHEETVGFFTAHDMFGYSKDHIRFFKQEMAPCVGYDGRILMEDKGRIAVSPNGNGGWFTSMMKAGLVEDMEARGVEYLSAFSVDNVCQRINDPKWVGAVLQSGCDVGAKVVRKADPNERVGVLCLEDGHPSICEYYEMTEEMITLKDEKGALLYNFGVILNYMFRLDKLKAIAAERMPVHIVEKKIPHLGDDGSFVKPEAPNGYKFELLILDMIHLMDTCLPYEVVRSREFAPIKNPTGVDSVVSAKALLAENGVAL